MSYTYKHSVIHRLRGNKIYYFIGTNLIYCKEQHFVVIENMKGGSKKKKREFIDSNKMADRTNDAS